MQSCGRVTASAASHSISSEINPQGGKTEPRSDRRYGGEEEGRREGAARSDNRWETWQACKALVGRGEHINI